MAHLRRDKEKRTMRKSIRYCTRLLVVIAVVASLQLLAPPAAGPGTPYVSALSIVVTSPTLAANSCPDKQCVNGRCQHVVGWTCASALPGQQCVRTTLCP